MLYTHHATQSWCATLGSTSLHNLRYNRSKKHLLKLIKKYKAAVSFETTSQPTHGGEALKASVTVDNALNQSPTKYSIRSFGYSILKCNKATPSDIGSKKDPMWKLHFMVIYYYKWEKKCRRRKKRQQKLWTVVWMIICNM